MFEYSQSSVVRRPSILKGLDNLKDDGNGENCFVMCARPPLSVSYMMGRRRIVFVVKSAFSLTWL